MSWPLFGLGDMAQRVRMHDWASTPLGSIEAWPEGLKAVVDLTLASPLVSSLACGPDRLLIYNDVAARLYGDRHPAALGRPLAETFADSYPTVAPLYDRVFRGEAVQVRSQPLAIRAGDEVFDACLSPVRDGTGAVIGAHMVGFEVGSRVRDEAALRISEERFRAFVTASADVVYRMSPDWSEMRELTGRGFLADTAQPSGAWMERYIHPDDQAAVRAAIAEAIATRSTFELEHRVLRADETLGWTLSRAVPIFEDGGTIREWLGTATDTTAKRQAAQALRESEALRRIALAGGRMGTWRWDLSNRLIRGDAAFLALWGFPASDELQPLSLFTARMSPEGAAEMAMIVTKAIEAREEFDGTLEIVSGPTAGHWIRWRGRAAENDHSLLYGVTFDITEQRQSEAALRKSETKYRTLFESMTEGYALGELRRDASGKAIDWRFIEFNPALERHTGMDPAASTGRWFSDLFPDADRTYWLEVYQSVLDTQSTRTFEEYWPPLDRWLGGVASPVADGRFNIMYRDVSEQRRLELSLRDSNERQAFLLELSDALRPLRAPADIQHAAMQLLGTRLGVLRAQYWEADPTGRYLDSVGGYANGVEAVTERVRMDDFGTSVREGYAAGRIMAVPDVALDPSVGEAELKAFDALGFRAWAGIPLVKDGRFVAALGLHHAAPHEWTETEIALTRETAERTWAALERAGAEAALHDAEERFRTMADSVPVLIWESDRSGVVSVNGHYLDFLGVPFDEVRGRGWEGFLHPDDASGCVAASRDAFDRGTLYEHVCRYRRADGQWRWLRNTGKRVGEGRFAGAAIDITDLLDAQQSLHESEEQQRLTLQLVPAMLWWAEPDGRDVAVNDQWRFYTGQQDADLPIDGWLDALHPDDLAEARAAFAKAFETGEPLERQLRIRQAADGYRWHLVRHVPVRHENGILARWFGAAIDIHDLRELQEHQQVLVAELQHRTRNLMGVVRSMFETTLRASADLGEFSARYRDRIDALARVQGLLSRLKHDERITFDRLIADEIKAVGGTERAMLEGPSDIALRSSTVQTFALALHELATNAVKYGALAQASGRLSITWHLEPFGSDDRPWLHVEWRERGVTMPLVEEAPQGDGQGRRLIERALPYQLGAKTTYVMGPDGVRCTIAVPVSSRMAEEEPGDGHAAAS